MCLSPPSRDILSIAKSMKVYAKMQWKRINISQCC